MSDAFEEQAWVKMGVAAALLKQVAEAQKTFLEEFATMLENALPGEAEVTRKGALFSKKTAQKVVVTLGENRYTLEDRGRGPLHAMVTHIVRGIALKTEDITLEEWLAILGAELEARLQISAEARDAIAHFFT